MGDGNYHYYTQTESDNINYYNYDEVIADKFELPSMKENDNNEKKPSKKEARKKSPVFPTENCLGDDKLKTVCACLFTASILLSLGALAIFAAVGGEKVEEDFSSRIDSKNQGQESTTLKNEPPTTTAIACEREAFQIYCPNSLKIDIADGFYGRKRIDFCTHKYGTKERSNIKCSMDVTNIVHSKCSGQTVCSLSVTNEAMRGDPCYGTYKYLQVKYRCTL